MNLNQIIQALPAYFDFHALGGTTFVRKTDAAPEWLDTMRLHAAIDDRGPDDWVYEAIRQMVGKLSDYCEEDTTIEWLRDHVGEMADGCVDVYNAELTRWLASHLNNIELVNDMIEAEECECDIIKALQAAQYKVYDTLGHTLLDMIEEQIVTE
jgi:hypothetical protein